MFLLLTRDCLVRIGQLVFQFQDEQFARFEAEIRDCTPSP